jgi:hypothetical protein
MLRKDFSLAPVKVGHGRTRKAASDSLMNKAQSALLKLVKDLAVRLGRFLITR